MEGTPSGTACRLVRRLRLPAFDLLADSSSSSCESVSLSPPLSLSTAAAAAVAPGVVRCRRCPAGVGDWMPLPLEEDGVCSGPFDGFDGVGPTDPLWRGSPPTMPPA